MPLYYIFNIITALFALAFALLHLLVSLSELKGQEDPWNLPTFSRK